MRIDSLGLQDVDFIKIDVEGHEPKVLSGAARTIAEHHPAIYMERPAEEAQKREAERLMSELGYSCRPHDVPLFNVRNFRNAQPPPSDDSFAVYFSHNILCLHSSHKPLRIP